MKFVLSFAALLLFSMCSGLYAQTPPINYKAIVKNNTGAVVANTSIVVQFSVLRGGTPDLFYTETHTPTTDDNGIIILNIGTGTPTFQTYERIPWDGEDHFLNVQIDTGSGLIDMGTTQFRAVPFAINSTTADNVNGLEALDEGVGQGWRLIGKDRDNYGIIGEDATDFSQSTTNSNIRGATGDRSFAAGSNTTASGDNSFTIGSSSNALGLNSVAGGNSTFAIAEGSFVLGVFTRADSFLSSAFGRYNVGGGTANAWLDSDPLFEIGNGTDNGNRRNALTLYKNGSLEVGRNVSTANCDFCFAAGEDNVASGYAAAALGFGSFSTGEASLSNGSSGTTASGNSAFANGVNAQASGDYAAAFGINSLATMDGSFASGNGAISTGASGVAMGINVSAEASGSVAMGNGTTASGINAVAMGSSTTASGNQAIALGSSSSASGIYSVATGSSTIATGVAAVVHGTGSTSVGNNSFSGGSFSSAEASNSFAFGNSNTASGISSVAMGAGNQAIGSRSFCGGLNSFSNGAVSFAYGTSASSDGANSIAIGTNTRANGSFSTAIGRDVTAYSNNEVVIGRLSTGYTPAGNNTDRAFVIGNGSQSGRSNAMTVLKNGNIGIGTETPQERLHVTDGRLRIGTETIEDTGNNRLSFDAGLFPNSDDLFNLGDSRNRWNAVWAVDGTINTSDRREKEHIQTLDYGLKEVLALDPVRFQWKSKPEQGEKLGLIAQDLLKVIPEVVKTHEYVNIDESGTLQKKELDRLGVYYSDLIPVLIKALQEQQKIIETQKGTLGVQESLLKELASRVTALENNQSN